MDTNRPPVTFARQVMDALPQRLEPVAGGGLGVRYFGRAVGFAVNYSPTHAIRFNLAGDAVEVLSAAYRPGMIEVVLGGRKMNPETVASIIG